MNAGAPDEALIFKVANESFENFTLNSDITTKKEKELFMILNDLTKEKINSKKKLKIIKENN